MRALLALAALSLAGLVTGCCQKKADPTPAPASSVTAPTANTTIKSGQADPVACRGMDTLIKCKECCDTRYWNVSFVGNKCACIKK